MRGSSESHRVFPVGRQERVLTERGIKMPPEGPFSRGLNCRAHPTKLQHLVLQKSWQYPPHPRSDWTF